MVNQCANTCPTTPRRLASLVCLWLIAVFWTLPAIADVDIAELELEQLPTTPYIPASTIANQVSNASSAVSIVTSKDIHDYGYRTLAEILNSMRGVFTTQDDNYSYLGGRGYSFPSEYAGKILLLIDGYKAQDSYFGQAYLGNDGLLDVQLIDRVEYIPGPGAYGYGDGASLGVINVFTKKGRDINGTQLGLAFGSHATMQERAMFGKELENGAEILLSASSYYSKGRSYQYEQSSYLAAGEDSGKNSEGNSRLFFKGSYQGWTLEAARVVRNIELPSARNSGEYTDPIATSDKNQFIQLKYDAQISRNLQFSMQSYYGDYLNENFEKPFQNFNRYFASSYGLDTKFVGTWFDRHTLVFGYEYRNTPQLNVFQSNISLLSGDLVTRSTHSSQTRRSIYAYDNIALTPNLDLNLGARFESTSAGNELFNPRIGFIYRPWDSTTLKFSTGVSHRQATPSEQDGLDPLKPERTKTSELVWQQSLGHESRLISSLYKYNIDSRILAGNPDVPSISTTGWEIEYEKIWLNGVRLKTSYAKQYARNSLGERPVGSPEDNIKLNVTAPILGEKLRGALAVRYIGDRRVISSDYLFTGGYTVADFTLTSDQFIPHWNASLSVRNLFDREYGDVTFPLFDDKNTFINDGRNVWFQLESTFK